MTSTVPASSTCGPTSCPLSTVTVVARRGPCTALAAAHTHWTCRKRHISCSRAPWRPTRRWETCRAPPPRWTGWRGRRPPWGTSRRRRGRGSTPCWRSRRCGHPRTGISTSRSTGSGSPSCTRPRSGRPSGTTTRPRSSPCSRTSRAAGWPACWRRSPRRQRLRTRSWPRMCWRRPATCRWTAAILRRARPAPNAAPGSSGDSRCGAACPRRSSGRSPISPPHCTARSPRTTRGRSWAAPPRTRTCCW